MGSALEVWENPRGKQWMREGSQSHQEAGLVKRLVANVCLPDDHLVVPAPDHTHGEQRAGGLRRLRARLAQNLWANKEKRVERKERKEEVERKIDQSAVWDCEFVSCPRYSVRPLWPSGVRVGRELEWRCSRGAEWWAPRGRAECRTRRACPAWPQWYSWNLCWTCPGVSAAHTSGEFIDDFLLTSVLIDDWCTQLIIRSNMYANQIFPDKVSRFWYVNFHQNKFTYFVVDY